MATPGEACALAAGFAEARDEQIEQRLIPSRNPGERAALSPATRRARCVLPQSGASSVEQERIQK
jgi:hypothetical protein